MASHLVAYQFKKGHSGNPGGSKQRGKKLFRKASPEALARLIDAFLYGGPNALEELYTSDDVNDVEKFCIQVIVKASQKGDPVALNILLDRFIGKVSEKMEVKNTTAQQEEDVTQLTDEEIQRRAELLDEAE